MKKNTLISAVMATLIAAVAISSCVKDRSLSTGSGPGPVVVVTGDSLIHYWNCNTDTLSILGTPTYTKGGGKLAYAGVRYDTVQPGSSINAVGSDTTITSVDGALRLRNPSGTFTLTLPTTGYKNIVLKYAAERSSKGAATNTVTYTTDGTNYINTAIAANSVYSVDTVYNLVNFDFTSDPAVNNNPNFKVQINFSNATGTTTGNDRFDNITVYGIKN